jgi:23S rRNA U2552 (ribose-2'-O)-methylase RlmE/FtsJ
VTSKVRRGPCSSQGYHWSLQGDITSSKTAAAVVAHFDGHHADLVVSDGAPDGATLLAAGVPTSAPNAALEILS